MKKLVVVAIVALASITGIQAQNVSFGPVASFNHSWLTGTSQADRQFNPGYKVGATLTYSINPNWAIGADAVFANEGFKARNTVANLKYTNRTNLNYIRVPLKLSYFFGELGDRFRPKFFVGPSMGFLVGGKTYIETENLNTKAIVKTQSNSKDNFKSFDLGAMLGAGFNYRISKSTWLNFDLDYTNGLVDVSKSDANWNANRNFGMSLGVAFPIGTIKQAK